MPVKRAPPPPRFTYDARSGRYRNSRTGRFITRVAVRREVDSGIRRSAGRVRGFGQELRDGTISLDAWRNSMRNEIRQQHLIAAMAAKGGRAQMTPADYGRVGQLVRKQYGYLEKFALDVDSGKVPLNGAFLSRSAMYSQASRGTYHAVERTEMMARQMTEERNILGKADHCPGCLEETARQWVGIGQLVPPGQRTCKVNCKCRLRYRDATGKESAA